MGGGEGGHRLGEIGHGQIVRHSQAQRVMGAAVESAALASAGQRQDAARIAQQPLAIVGQPHAAPAAGEQWPTGGALQPADLLADGGLGAVDPLPGAGEAAASTTQTKACSRSRSSMATWGAGTCI